MLLAITHGPQRQLLGFHLKPARRPSSDDPLPVLGLFPRAPPWHRTHSTGSPGDAFARRLAPRLLLTPVARASFVSFHKQVRFFAAWISHKLFIVRTIECTLTPLTPTSAHGSRDAKGECGEGEGQRGQLFSTSPHSSKPPEGVADPGLPIDSRHLFDTKTLTEQDNCGLETLGRGCWPWPCYGVTCLCLRSALLWVFLTRGRPGVPFDCKDW